jgi:hypothetical protein
MEPPIAELGSRIGDWRKMVMEVKDIRDKLKYWDYENVLQVHESFQFVNESINELGLVPESF